MRPGRRLARLIALRLASGLATLFVVTILVFAAIHLVPGSYADIVLGDFATPAERAHLAASYGLDRPLPVQYFEWLRHLLTGDFGTSLGTGESVASVLNRSLPVTIELASLALLFTLVVGLPLAVLAGMARRHSVRSASRLGGAIAMSTPNFVIGSILVYLFSRYALYLPVGGYVPLGSDPLANLRSMALPAFTLGVFGVALVVRTGRDAVVSVLNSPHVTAALARGEGNSHVMRHHVLRNATIPVLTVLATYVGYLLGGAVIVENLFSLPGLGQAALTAINRRDYAVVQGTVLVAAAAFITINILADIAYGLVDPRVRAATA